MRSPFPLNKWGNIMSRSYPWPWKSPYQSEIYWEWVLISNLRPVFSLNLAIVEWSPYAFLGSASVFCREGSEWGIARLFFWVRGGLSGTLKVWKTSGWALARQFCVVLGRWVPAAWWGNYVGDSKSPQLLDWEEHSWKLGHWVLKVAQCSCYILTADEFIQCFKLN